MGRVQSLVGMLSDDARSASGVTHTQSIRLPQVTHIKLNALADVLGPHKSTLASDLLRAAIDEAIEALPREGIQAYGDDGTEIQRPSLYQQVKRRIEELYDEEIGGQAMSGVTMTQEANNIQTAPAWHGSPPSAPPRVTSVRGDQFDDDGGTVLSVPAGRTAEFIEAFDIHACPDTYLSYKPTDYITFRATGGVMERLYDLAKTRILVLDPEATSEEWARALAQHDLTEAERERVLAYFSARQRADEFGSRSRYMVGYRVYVLPPQGDEGCVELPHRPRMLKNIQNHTYFSRDELASGKPFVQILSQRNRG